MTFEQVSKALGSPEAVGSLNDAAAKDDKTPSVQKAAIMAGMGNVLEEIRKAESAAGAKVLTTPHDERAARLQSLIASGQAADLKYAALPTGGFEAMFDTNDWFGWASVAWEKLKHLTPHAMARPKSVTAQPFPDAGRIAILGDWGTGLYGAPKIGEAVRKDRDPFAMLLHLGDVYYSGTKQEIGERFLEVWPKRTDAISRALNSNHEMYSGGDAYSTARFRRSVRTAATSPIRMPTGRSSVSMWHTMTMRSTTNRSIGLRGYCAMQETARSSSSRITSSIRA